MEEVRDYVFSLIVVVFTAVLSAVAYGAKNMFSWREDMTSRVIVCEQKHEFLDKKIEDLILTIRVRDERIEEKFDRIAAKLAGIRDSLTKI